MFHPVYFKYSVYFFNLDNEPDMSEFSLDTDDLEFQVGQTLPMEFDYGKKATITIYSIELISEDEEGFCDIYVSFRYPPKKS